MAVLFFAETYATQLGLGALVWDAWSARVFDQMFAGVISMALMGFGFYVILDWMERVTCPWAEHRRSTKQHGRPEHVSWVQAPVPGREGRVCPHTF